MTFRREPVVYRTIYQEAATLGEATLVQLERMNANLVR
jgi:hypothetical protein